MDDFGVKLVVLMKRADINQKMLANMIGVSQQTVSYYINGRAVPSMDTAKKIAKALNTSIAYLFDDDAPLAPGKKGETTISTLLEVLKEQDPAKYELLSQLIKELVN